ncbi:hypothetical protein DL769_001023 [Monosporascus sp. CRB-8-3]|nr:hypothetical protein DL769_001023 [Monosporascus sp. CRB-8-3]
MAGLLLLLALTVVMALASFLAGALPLSMALSQSQLRLISSVGIGILVGTSLVVIIPEGVEAITEAGLPSHSKNERSSSYNARNFLAVRWGIDDCVSSGGHFGSCDYDPDIPVSPPESSMFLGENAVEIAGHMERNSEEQGNPAQGDSIPKANVGVEVPTFYVGLSLLLGFILMFLVDRLPRIASENFHPQAPPRQISLSNLGGSPLPGDDEEAEGFLGSLTPTPKQSRSLATTIGLVIHAAADGIAMGASAASSDASLGLIVFLAIMIHKAPAAFGLTSVLLKQGLSKRAARGHLIVFSLASPFGAWTTFVLVALLGGGAGGEWDQWWTGMLLLFSAGTFLYVAMHAMQEGDSPSSHDLSTSANGYAESNSMAQRKHPPPQIRDTLAAILGMLLPLLTQFGHSH